MTDAIDPLDPVSAKRRKKLLSPDISSQPIFLHPLFLPFQTIQVKFLKIIFSSGEQVKNKVWENLEKNRVEKKEWVKLDQKKENWARIFGKIDQGKFLNRRVDLIPST